MQRCEMPICCPARPSLPPLFLACAATAAGGLPPSARHPSGLAGPVVGHNNPPPQPTNTLEIQQCQQTNQATDLATTRALQVLASTRLQLNALQQASYTPRPTGSAATDGSGSKRRKTSRGADASGSRGGSKGLRHFSMKVCEKVEAKGRTTYNEVADELVGEMSKMEAMNKNGQYDEKNIRRRVYDAINVLMAMDIIQKEKKEILWRGFPRLSCNSADRVKAERDAKIKEVEQKQLYLQVGASERGRGGNRREWKGSGRGARGVGGRGPGDWQGGQGGRAGVWHGLETQSFG